MKKFLKLIILVLLINVKIVYAEEFTITSDHVILYNLNDNKVLYEKNSTEKVQVASLTKIMTTIVAIEHTKDLNEEIVVPRNAFNGILEYSQAGLKAGNKVTIKDLLYGAMLPSGADAVNTLALHIGETIPKFVELMNQKAADLKLLNTHFDNPIGMDSDNNYSTAQDVATILLYALQNNVFKEIFTAREYTIPNLKLPMKSTLIGYSKSYGLDVSDITGAKSGFTDGAGLCLASTAIIDDVNYLLITLGADTKNRSNAVRDSLQIYDYYSSTYSYQNVLTKNTSLATIPIKWGKEKQYTIKAADDLKLYLENGIRKNKIKYKYDGINELNYEIKKGDKLGTITVLYRNEELYTYDVYLDDNLEYYHPVIYIMIAIALILMLYSIKLMLKQKKKKKKKTSKKQKRRK